MNSLYTLGVRQTNSLQSDLERLRNGDNSASLLGLTLVGSGCAFETHLMNRSDIGIPIGYAQNCG